MEVASEPARGAWPVCGGVAPQQQRSERTEEAAGLLGKRCKIQVKDGRVLVGDFTCLDKQGNIILTNTYEHMQLNGKHHEKIMGQVLVPAAHRMTCEFEVCASDQQLLSMLQPGPENG